MSRTPFHRIRRLFDDLVELPPGERGAFLARQNDLGENTRRQLHNLLRADAQVDHLDVRTALGEGAQVLAQEQRWAGQRIGAFEMRTPLGQGGRGSTWLAERVDGRGEHCVAVKLLRPDLREAVARARLNRQRPLPARLQHPAIAALRELGELDDGSAYAIMEYIDGLPIDRHVREHRLALAPRVQLLLPLCEAVAQAHRQRIVHGDIKPGNVLIDRNGQPKLLDIGIAELLRDATEAPGVEQTAAVRRPVTPAQTVHSAALGASGDIYALGLLLYQLLAGVPPFDADRGRPARSPQDIGGNDPPPPSRRADDAARGRRLRLPRDLELITLQCLQVQPHDRYACADALADDLRRYLQGRPVLARKGKLLYRSGRLLARHRLAVGLSLLLAAAALGVGMLR